MGKGFLPGMVMVGVVSFRQVYEARCLKSVILGGSSLDLARLEREMVVMVVGAMARWAGDKRWEDEDRYSCKLGQKKNSWEGRKIGIIWNGLTCDLYPA